MSTSRTRHLPWNIATLTTIFFNSNFCVCTLYVKVLPNRLTIYSFKKSSRKGKLSHFINYCVGEPQRIFEVFEYCNLTAVIVICWSRSTVRCGRGNIQVRGKLSTSKNWLEQMSLNSNRPFCTVLCPAYFFLSTQSKSRQARILLNFRRELAVGTVCMIWAKISKSGKRRKSFFCNNFFKIVQKLIL